MTRVQRIVDCLYRIPLGFVNAFVIAQPGQWTLIDCGLPGHDQRIAQAIREIGGDIADLKHILVTHGHADHCGSLAAIQQQAPQAQTLMHAEDAVMVRQGFGLRKDAVLRPAPGMHNFLIYHLFVRRVSPVFPPGRVDRHVCDGQFLNIAGGIRVIHAPGHSRGQVCFLWQNGGGVLFAADAAACVFRPDYSVAYEDFELGKQTLRELALHPFEYACFGHGKTLIHNANKQFCRAFARGTARKLVPAPEIG